MSALPGFLSVANLTASDRNYKAQQKFRDRISGKEMLELSRVEEFSGFLQSNLIRNVQAKIKIANYNKIQVTLSQLRTKLLETKDNMIGSKNKMDQIEASSNKQIDSLVGELKGHLNQVAHQVVDEFARDLRKSVYDSIDTDLSNDEFKSMMKRKITESEESVKEGFISKMSDAIERFNGETQEVLKQFQEYSKNIAVSFDGGGVLDLSNAFTFNPKSKQSPLGLFLGLGSKISGAVIVAAELSNPVGWALLVVGLVFSLVKMIRGFFDKDYKMAQQKNAADSKISELSDEIRKNLNKNIDEVNEHVEAAVDEVKENMSAVSKQFKLMSMTFDEVVLRIKVLENELKSEVK